MTSTLDLLRHLTDEDRAQFRHLAERVRKPWTPLPGPQMHAFLTDADVIGYGGAAGGGKSDLICGLALMEHRRALVIRAEKAQTEGIVQRMAEIVGSTDGYNSQHSRWNLPIGTKGLLEFGGIDNLGDERRWQGRQHDLKAFDEATEMRESQVRFIMGWNRSPDPGQRSRVLMTFNPPTTVEGRWVIEFFAPWLQEGHPNPAMPGELRWFTTIDGKDQEVPDRRPFVLVGGQRAYNFDPSIRAEDVIVPRSRTFIPARVTDNPYYMRSGYIATLQALPEPLRSQMLYGSFRAGIKDDPWQVIPTEWVRIAMDRWKKPSVLPEMDSMGVDVARGGDDHTIIARRHGMWFDEPLAYPGSQTPDGPKVAGLTIAAQRNRAPIHIDVIGVGSSPYDFLMEAEQQVMGVNVSERSAGKVQGGLVSFLNLRSELWWRMREALDPNANNGIALPPDKRLLADLCAPTWKLTSNKIQVASREDIIKAIGRSPDYGSAYVLALVDTPKRDHVIGLLGRRAVNRRDYDPFADGRVRG